MSFSSLILIGYLLSFIGAHWQTWQTDSLQHLYETNKKRFLDFDIVDKHLVVSHQENYVWKFEMWTFTPFLFKWDAHCLILFPTTASRSWIPAYALHSNASQQTENSFWRCKNLYLLAPWMEIEPLDSAVLIVTDFAYTRTARKREKKMSLNHIEDGQ